MRRNLILALGLAAVLSVGFAAMAVAKFDTFQAGNLVLKADGGVSPKTLPKRKMAPVTVRVRGKISDRVSSHPAAFREAVIDFDRNGAINTTGLPVCRGSQLTARDTPAAKRVCGKTQIGSGKGKVQVAFREQGPIVVTAPITVFNGGTKRGKTTLYIHTFLTVPVPIPVVTTVTIKKVKKGRYGLSTISKVPQIAGGSGSVLEFDLRVGKTFKHKGKKRSYLMAKCSDGKFHARIIKALFRNEAEGPRTETTLRGTVIRPCKPRG